MWHIFRSKDLRFFPSTVLVVKCVLDKKYSIWKLNRKFTTSIKPFKISNRLKRNRFLKKLVSVLTEYKKPVVQSFKRKYGTVCLPLTMAWGQKTPGFCTTKKLPYLCIGGKVKESASRVWDLKMGKGVVSIWTHVMAGNENNVAEIGFSNQNMSFENRLWLDD